MVKLVAKMFFGVANCYFFDNCMYTCTLYIWVLFVSINNNFIYMTKFTNEEINKVQHEYSLDIYDNSKTGRLTQSKVLDEIGTLEKTEWIEILESEWDLRTQIRLAIQNRFRPKKKFRVLNAVKRTGEKCWLIQRFV